MSCPAHPLPTPDPMDTPILHPGGLYRNADGTFKDAHGEPVDLNDIDAATLKAYGLNKPKADAKKDDAPKA